jgi:hypothetical protein
MTKRAKFVIFIENVFHWKNIGKKKPFFLLFYVLTINMKILITFPLDIVRWVYGGGVYSYPGGWQRTLNCFLIPIPFFVAVLATDYLSYYPEEGDDRTEQLQ